MSNFLARVYTPNDKSPIVISVSDAFQVLNKRGECRNRTDISTPDCTRARIYLPPNLQPLFKKFAACQNTLTTDADVNFVQGVPLLTYRAWIWHNLLLAAEKNSVKTKLNSIWGAGMLASETLASDVMANVESVPYSADSLSGIVSFASQTAVGEYSNAGGLIVKNPTLDSPDYEPYDGYANLYSLITNLTHLSVSAATTASSMGSAAHLAAEIAFSAPRRNAPRAATTGDPESRRREECRKMVSMAAPLAAECGYTLATAIKQKYRAPYKGSNLPFVLGHLTRDGTVFAGFPDAVFESNAAVFSVELKTRWGTEDGLVRTSQSFKKAYAQALLQALAAFQHYPDKTVTAVLAIAQVPKESFVTDIRYVLLEKEVSNTTHADAYGTLLEYLGSIPANSKRPNTFLDNFAAIPIKTPVYKRAVVEKTAIYVCSNIKTDNASCSWTLYTPMNMGPGNLSTLTTAAIPFTNFPANAFEHGAVMISCKSNGPNTLGAQLRSGVRIGSATSYAIEWACQSVAEATAFAAILKASTDSLQRRAFEAVKQIHTTNPYSLTARVKATGKVQNITLETFDLLNIQKFVPDRNDPSRKVAWAADKGVDHSNSLVWLPELFCL